MENLSGVSNVGWAVIGFAVFLIFLLAWFRGVKLGNGEKAISVGRTVDRKLETFKKELAEKEKDRVHDEELRKKLFRESNLIDEKLKADMRRIVRSMSDDIYRVFAEYMRCEFPAVSVDDKIKGELFQRIDENHMREKLKSTEIDGYLSDVSHDIENKYAFFQRTIKTASCGENYPEWEIISPGISIILYNWAVRTRDAIAIRCREKINLYASNRKYFNLPEYQKNSVDDPISKNEKYLDSLDTIKGGLK